MDWFVPQNISELPDAWTRLNLNYQIYLPNNRKYKSVTQEKVWIFYSDLLE
jgi:hypothetical protein